jgi:hypothetical protein
MAYEAMFATLAIQLRISAKPLGPKAHAMSTYEKECLPILVAINKWKAYLQQREFTILIIDHKSLIHLSEQRLTQGIQHKAFVKLLGMQYKIQYKQGLENRSADALSHQSTTTVDELVTVSTVVPKWLEIIVEG